MLINGAIQLVNGIVKALPKILSSLMKAMPNAMKGIWEGVQNVFSGVGDWFGQKFTDAKDKITSAFDSIKTKLAEPFETARDTIEEIANAIKGFFSGEIEMPEIKTPKFTVTPEGWEIGDLLEGVIPKLGITWHAKGGIMTEPTLFGYNPATGTAHVGGEAGDEAIAPISTLQQYVSSAVASQNGALVAILSKILDAIIQMDENMGGNLRDALDGVSFDVNKREFARLVKESV